METKYTTYTFVEAFKILRDTNSYARCCGYPYICMYKNHTLYVSTNEGLTFEILHNFPIWMKICKDPEWVISTDMKTWRNRNDEKVVDL